MVTRKPPIRSVSESISEVSAHMCRRGLWWSVLRISIAAIVISGAYIAGMICGMQRGEYDSEEWGEHQGRRMEGMGQYGSPMMK